MFLSGCCVWNWIITDNPNAPSVQPINGKPNDWPTFNATNNVSTNNFVTNNVCTNIVINKGE